MTELPKTFEPGPIEARWYAHWEERGLFRPDRGDAEPWTIVMPPPNVTGSLHIGHALDNTLQDIVTRRERMLGKDALWVVGMDHAGIATQMVVERNLEEQAPDPELREAALHLDAGDHRALDALGDRVLVLERLDRRGLGGRVAEERLADLVDGAPEGLRAAQRVAHAQAAEAVDLRECAQQDQVREAARSHLDPETLAIGIATPTGQ